MNSRVSPWTLKIKELESAPGLVHGFSTLAIGSVGLTHALDRAAALQARRAFASELGLDADTLTVAGAIHGARVARVDRRQVEVVEGVDALITDRPNVALFAAYADCYPIVLWDHHRRCAALVHAGWRGTAAGVAAAALQALQEEFGSDPAQLEAGLGPGICGRCYEVGGEVASRFASEFVSESPNGRFLLDLAAANRVQLAAGGVRKIHSLGLCTKETEYLPSHRRAPDGARFGAIVSIR